MAEVNDLYSLLNDLLASASQGDKTRVLQLNQDYEGLVSELYPRLPRAVRLEYDLCRQSCVLGFTFLPFEKERLLQDARTRFTQLPVPDGYRRSGR